MKFICTLLLIALTTTFSFGLKTNCNKNDTQTCTIWMTPNETYYSSVFLTLIDPMIELAMDYAFEGNEPDVDPFNTVNELIIDEINKTIVENFVRKIVNFTYRNPTNITIVKDLSNVTGIYIKDLPSNHSNPSIPLEFSLTTKSSTVSTSTTTKSPTTPIPTTSKPTTTTTTKKYVPTTTRRTTPTVSKPEIRPLSRFEGVAAPKTPIHVSSRFLKQ
uniref:Secreted protein n=1 Tax=Strongyloides papillosus TaxID=174720 RepID=A0A0N5CBX3_STREA